MAMNKEKVKETIMGLLRNEDEKHMYNILEELQIPTKQLREAMKELEAENKIFLLPPTPEAIAITIAHNATTSGKSQESSEITDHMKFLFSFVKKR